MAMVMYLASLAFVAQSPKLANSFSICTSALPSDSFVMSVSQRSSTLDSGSLALMTRRPLDEAADSPPRESEAPFQVPRRDSLEI